MYVRRHEDLAVFDAAFDLFCAATAVAPRTNCRGSASAAVRPTAAPSGSPAAASAAMHGPPRPQPLREPERAEHALHRHFATLTAAEMRDALGACRCTSPTLPMRPSRRPVIACCGCRLALRRMLRRALATVVSRSTAPAPAQRAPAPARARLRHQRLDRAVQPPAAPLRARARAARRAARGVRVRHPAHAHHAPAQGAEPRRGDPPGGHARARLGMVAPASGQAPTEPRRLDISSMITFSGSMSQGRPSPAFAGTHLIGACGSSRLSFRFIVAVAMSVACPISWISSLNDASNSINEVLSYQREACVRLILL